MVCYCCVKGCRNTSITKSKSPDSLLSFHTFPSDQELKTKWIRAIGRPHWDPPNHARICSAHFQLDNFSCHDRSRVRLKTDAVPTKSLPPNANFDASNVETCRICLATDIKIYNIETSQLGTYLHSFNGLADHPTIEGLPKFVCYLCVAVIVKCHRLFEKSLVSQTVLLDIFAQKGQINKKLIEEYDNCKFKMDPFVICTMSNDIQSQFNNDSQISDMNSKTSLGLKDDKEIILVDKDTKGNFLIYQLDEPNQLVYKYIGNNKIEKGISVKSEDSINRADIKSDSEGNIRETDPQEDNVPSSPLQEDDMSRGVDEDEDPSSEDISNFDDEDIEVTSIKNNKLHIDNNIEVEQIFIKNEDPKSEDYSTEMPKRQVIKKRRQKTDEREMQQYFDIVKLSVPEQIEEWRTAMSRRSFKSGAGHECEICGKICGQAKLLTVHMYSHNPRRGKAQCPVCKVRYKNEKLVKSHINRDHSRKFYCKVCSKMFYQMRLAKRHQLLHAGHKYQCTLCPFASLHTSALCAHMLTQHRQPHACEACGRAFVNESGLARHRSVAHPNIQEEKGKKSSYRCKICGIDFASEGARRVHVLTSSQHGINDASESPSMTNAAFNCFQCGETFPSLYKLKSHRKEEHPKPLRRARQNACSIQCQFCEETLSGRKEHWYHILRKHPRQTKNYQAIITVICDICGKGFQNSTKLQIHKLRHSSPKVRCPHCPRLFYDQHALSLHATTHSTLRPYVCGTCGQTFKLKSNFTRHANVHSDEARYSCPMCDKKFKYSTSLNLHVRTVHNKEPYPSRKPRNRRAKEDDDDNHV